MNIEKVKKLNPPASLVRALRAGIPKTPGCYLFKDNNDKIIYIGKASNLKSRVVSYWQKSANHTPAKIEMINLTKKIEWIETDSEIEALLLEANLIKKHQPSFNIVLRDDKRFSYIKVSLEDEIPGIFITRKIDKAGKYYGPFTSQLAARETLKVIRKIWPYCTERNLKNLPAGKAGKPCFYFQINRCLGVCAGIINKKEYLEKVINPIQLFLEGKKDRLIRKQELGIRNYEKKLKKLKSKDKNYEEFEREINALKFQVLNMKNVLEHTNIISLTEKYAADVIELAKVLSLPKVPMRIEGYDISNIFGQEAVGSMVVFSNGEPDKNEYRKFKIKIGQGKANDTKMLKEIIERRFGNDWPMPDLIIIDGGKGQRNAALQILNKFKLDIPVIAVSKGQGLRSSLAPDKIFFPEEKQALVLPLASPALHIIKRVRDEAHRFAIKYHQLLRKKKLLN